MSVLANLGKVNFTPSERVFGLVDIGRAVGFNDFKVWEVFWKDPMFSQVAVLVQVLLLDFFLTALPAFVIESIFDFIYELLLLTWLWCRRFIFQTQLFLDLSVDIDPLPEALKIFLSRAKTIDDFNGVN